MQHDRKVMLEAQQRRQHGGVEIIEPVAVEDHAPLGKSEEVLEHRVQFVHIARLQPPRDANDNRIERIAHMMRSPIVPTGNASATGSFRRSFKNLGFGIGSHPKYEYSHDGHNVETRLSRNLKRFVLD